MHPFILKVVPCVVSIYDLKDDMAVMVPLAADNSNCGIIWLDEVVMRVPPAVMLMVPVAPEVQVSPLLLRFPERVRTFAPRLNVPAVPVKFPVTYTFPPCVKLLLEPFWKYPPLKFHAPVPCRIVAFLPMIIGPLTVRA